jgi:hypothetical protein
LQENTPNGLGDSSSSSKACIFRSLGHRHSPRWRNRFAGGDTGRCATARERRRGWYGFKEAYEGGKREDVLYISKGIHQPNTDPHMQLKLRRGNSWYTLHLNVSASVVGDPDLDEGYFH